MKSVQNEVFDVVNERDEVVGRESRSEVHRLGLKHRAIHVLLTNSPGEVFLQKRSSTKDTWPRAWDSSVSGHLDAGEDYYEAARREVREELGWELTEPLTRIFKIDACEETGQEFVWVYRGEAEGPFNLHPEEIESGRWFSVSEVEALIGDPTVKDAASFRYIWSLVKGLGFFS
jgi:isopentenyl-diphosphate delta-isomerase type 1